MQVASEFCAALRLTSVCVVPAAWGQVTFPFRLLLWLAFQKAAALPESSLFLP